MSINKVIMALGLVKSSASYKARSYPKETNAEETGVTAGEEIR